MEEIIEEMVFNGKEKINPPRPPKQVLCKTFRPPPAQWLTVSMVDSLSYVAHESAAKLHPWLNSPDTTLQNNF